MSRLLIQNHARDGRYDYSYRGSAQELVANPLLPDHDGPISRRQGTQNIGLGGIVDDENVLPIITVGMACEGEHEHIVRTFKKPEVSANVAGRGHAERRVGPAQVNQASIVIEDFPVGCFA